MRQPTLSMAALVLASTLLAWPARAAEKVLIGAFDVGPGGLPQKFNPLIATAGFTWYNKYLGRSRCMTRNSRS